jgi:glutathione S-transferase
MNHHRTVIARTTMQAVMHFVTAQAPASSLREVQHGWRLVERLARGRSAALLAQCRELAARLLAASSREYTAGRYVAGDALACAANVVSIAFGEDPDALASEARSASVSYTGRTP